MRFDIVTLFPELFAPFLESGVTRRAYASGQVAVRLWDPRTFAEGNYRRVDDRPMPRVELVDLSRVRGAAALPGRAIPFGPSWQHPAPGSSEAI